MSTSVRRRLATQIPPVVHPESTDVLLTPADVCLRLRISRKTLQRMNHGCPPAISYVKTRGGYRYRRAALEFYISQHEVKAVA
jgi:hypothetical protein